MSTAPLPDATSPQPGPERRIALMPVLVAVVALVVAIALTVTIVTLATRGAPPTALAPAPTPSDPDAAGSAPVATAPPSAPRPEAGPGECVDALGDGGSVDLDTVSVVLAGGEVIARFTLDSIPDAGETLLGITATGRQDRTVLLAVRLVDGKVDEVFTATLGADNGGDDGGDDNSGNGNNDKNNDNEIDGYDERRASVEGRDVTVTFPDDVVDDLGRDWSWSASASGGGSGDRCPAEGELVVQR